MMKTTSKHHVLHVQWREGRVDREALGPLQEPVTWYGTNYAGKQVTQWEFQNKGKSSWTGMGSSVLEVASQHN